jgi:hypothetical protein
MTYQSDPFGDYAEADFDEQDELRAQDKAERNYWSQLAAHPHPQDPDHPEHT